MDTSQSFNGVLKLVAPRNVSYMSVTLETSQPPTGWPNDAAPLNVWRIDVTADVSQSRISALKCCDATPQSRQKSPAMSVTWDVSHFSMGPYVASAADWSASHAATAVLMVASVRTTGQMPSSFGAETPHAVAAHALPAKALFVVTLVSTHQPRSWSKAEAPLKMSCMFVTPPTLQAPRSWSNDAAPWNMPLIFVTLATLQPLSGWLNDVAPSNMNLKSPTLSTLQSPSGRLNAAASANIQRMSVTWSTCQSPSGWSNDAAP